ncbi:MAG: UDP-2,3-diacylglucosamine diphosphatase [Bacteroidales bacterium]|nr:UDP-2,3-diacylglucosamine diphosphatase [Bacteroidales bacterium]
MQKDRLYFVTDAHLGSGPDSPQRERELCTLLDNIEPHCHTLVLLGDMFDFWFTYRHLVPRGHVRLLGKLAAMADNGTEIHYFTGNHDMWLFDYLTNEIGLTQHEQPATLTFGECTFLIGHGDGLGNTDPSFNRLRRLFRSPFCQRMFKLLPSAFTFGIAHRWSDNNKVRHAQQDTLRYLGDEREGIVQYCHQRLAQEHFDYCVFGHRHTPLARQLQQGTTYINVGDWLINRNYAYFAPGQGLTLLDNRQPTPLANCPISEPPQTPSQPPENQHQQ